MYLRVTFQNLCLDEETIATTLIFGFFSLTRLKGTLFLPEMVNFKLTLLYHRCLESILGYEQIQRKNKGEDRLHGTCGAKTYAARGSSKPPTPR